MANSKRKRKMYVDVLDFLKNGSFHGNRISQNCQNSQTVLKQIENV
jgi:hypothetical protein